MLRTMEGQRLSRDGIPGDVMGVGCAIAAFIAVCHNGLARGRGETGEELPDKGVGDGVGGHPAIIGSLYLGMNERLFRNQSDQRVNIGSKA